MPESTRPAAPSIVDRRATIIVLAHKFFGLPDSATLAFLARGHWTPEGNRVLVHRGVKTPPPPGDLAILHVPLTHVPQRLSDLATHYPRTVNGSVTDTSKRRIATDLLEKDDRYDGPVIVKTDLNHTGGTERRLRRESRSWRKRLLYQMERRLPPHWFGRLPQNRYLVFERKSLVPGWVWRSRGLVVQPFHAERRGGHFVLHQWYFCGDRDCVSTFLSTDPLVKLATVTERLPLHKDVPDEIRRRRAELKFDYGKFDYVIADGVPILLDANNTPDEGAGQEKHPRVLAICAELAGGLQSLLP